MVNFAGNCKKIGKMVKICKYFTYSLHETFLKASVNISRMFFNFPAIFLRILSTFCKISSDFYLQFGLDKSFDQFYSKFSSILIQICIHFTYNLHKFPPPKKTRSRHLKNIFRFFKISAHFIQDSRNFL